MKSIIYLLTILFLSFLLACSEDPPISIDVENLDKKPIRNPPVPLVLEHSLNQIVAGTGERSRRKYEGTIKVWTNYSNTWTRECNGIIKSVAIGDIDGDDYDELIAIKNYITGNGNNRTYHFDLQIWEDGDIDTPTEFIELVEPERESAMRMAIGDADNDGNENEIVIVGDTYIQLWRYDGNNLIKDNWQINVPSPSFPRYVTIGDVDNDGDNEILVASASTTPSYNYIAVYDFGNTNPIYTIPIPNDDPAGKTEVVNVDDDLDNELIMEGSLQFYVWEFENGNFTPIESENLGGGAIGIVAANFDGISGNEIVVGTGVVGANSVQVFKYIDNGVGSRTLTKLDEVTINDAVSDIFAGDADNNGDIEFIVGTHNGLLIYNYNSGGIQPAYSDNFGEWVQSVYVK